jgi:hypothetical protein
MPAAAGATTKTLQAGPFGANAKQLQDAFGDANASLICVIHRFMTATVTVTP